MRRKNSKNMNLGRKLKQWFGSLPMRTKISCMMISVFFLLLGANFFVYYTMTQSQFEENISQTGSMMIQQSAVTLEKHLADIAEYLVQIKGAVQDNVAMADLKTDEYNDINNRIEYDQLFNLMLGTNENYKFVHSLAILDRSGFCYTYMTEPYTGVNNQVSFSAMEKKLKGKPIYSWSGIITNVDYFGANRNNLICFSAAINNYDQMQSIILINLRVDALRDYLDSISNENQYVVLLLPDGTKITDRALQAKMENDASLSEVLNEARGKKQAKNGKYMVLSSTIPINGWQLELVYSMQDLRSSAGEMTGFLGITFTTIALVALLSSIFIAYYITRPIRRLTDIMAQVGDDHLGMRFIPKYQDEVGALAGTFNAMMDNIQNLNRNVIEEQNRNKLAYLKMLQLQIKPHFLYNSLEAAKFLVEMQDSRATEMIEAIGQFYKSCLGNATEDATVGEELDHLEYYLKILKFRYQSQLNYCIESKPELLSAHIVRFTLQPLVENAVYHGVKQKRGQGEILITVRQNGAVLELTVHDNGAGIPLEVLKKVRCRLSEQIDLKSAEHIGLYNVHQRLQTRYGKEYGLVIESVLGEFTKVTVRVPLT